MTWVTRSREVWLLAPDSYIICLLNIQALDLYKIKPFLLLSILSLFLFLPGLSRMPVIDRDEAHFAQATRQMIQTGNYFQIRFQDNTRFQKPPGINWLQAASVNIFSNADSTSIWPYRLPSLLGALFSVLLTYFFARRFMRFKIASIAATLMAASLLLVIEAHMAVIDASLLASMLLMQGCLWVIYQAGVDKKSLHWGWAAVFWLAMSYGFLLKGVTPLVGFLTVITLCITDKSVKWLRGLRILPGLLLFGLINFVWLIMVNHAEQSNYLLQMINKDLLPKLKGGHESHGNPPLYHLFILPLTFWPASLFLWPAGQYAWLSRHLPVVKFLLAWLIPSWIFFECMPTKLPQYILPLLPALAILCALAIDNHTNGSKPSRFIQILQILWGILTISLALAIAVMFYMVMHQISMISVILIGCIIALTGMTVNYARKGFYQTAITPALTMAILLFMVVFTEILPTMEPVWVTRNAAQLVNNQLISEEKPLQVVGFEEPSLVFNLNTKLIQFTDGINAITSLRKNPNQLLLVEASAFKTFPFTHANLKILNSTKGFDYSKGHWVKLLLIGQQNSGENQHVHL